MISRYSDSKSREVSLAHIFSAYFPYEDKGNILRKIIFSARQRYSTIHAAHDNK